MQRLSTNGPGPAASGAPLPDMSIRKIMTRFILASLVALVVLTALTALISRRIATREAMEDARRLTATVGQSALRPAITPALVRGEADAVTRFADTVRASLVPLDMVRTKLWDQTGRLLYSDEPRLIGQRFELGDDAKEVLRTGVAHTEVSDLTDEENRFDQGDDARLLEVYTRVVSPDGAPLLFETYFAYSVVSESSRRVWRQVAPVVIGSLLLLALVQLPLALAMARRLRQSQGQREHLLNAAIQSSEAERRRIAQDLHDGTVQDLAGVSLELAAASRRITKHSSAEDGEHGEARVLESASMRVRDAITSLRTLLVDIYPPNMEDTRLEQALTDLTSRLSARGIDATLSIDLPDRPLRRETATLLHRIAQEAQRNAVRHASATELQMSVTHDDNNVCLEVTDNGSGFDVDAALAAPSRGHVGLRVLRDLAAEAGGTMSIISDLGVGTTIRVEVPQ